MKLAMLVSSLLSIFGSSSTQKDCELTGGDSGKGWLIRIFLNGQTVAHGALVHTNRVLSVFSPFIAVADDDTLVEKYGFIAYEERGGETSCYLMTKARTFVSPPEWPKLKIEDVRDIAFWELRKVFDVTTANFPFAFPSNDDITTLATAIAKTKTGTLCEITTFTDKDSFYKGTTTQRKVLVSAVRSCETYFCADGYCNLYNRFYFCTVEKRDTTQDAWERGAILMCNGVLMGILGLNGESQKTKGRNLFIDFVTAWEVYKGSPIRPPTTAGSTVTEAEITTTTTTTTIATTTTSAAAAATTSNAKTTEVKKRTTGKRRTTTKQSPGVKTTASGPTVFTSRIPEHHTVTRKTTETPTFIRTVPKHAKPASGKTLAINPGTFALCAVVLYVGG